MDVKRKEELRGNAMRAFRVAVFAGLGMMTLGATGCTKQTRSNIWQDWNQSIERTFTSGDKVCAKHSTNKGTLTDSNGKEVSSGVGDSYQTCIEPMQMVKQAKAQADAQRVLQEEQQKLTFDMQDKQQKRDRELATKQMEEQARIAALQKCLNQRVAALDPQAPPVSEGCKEILAGKDLKDAAAKAAADKNSKPKR